MRLVASNTYDTYSLYTYCSTSQNWSSMWSVHFHANTSRSLLYLGRDRHELCRLILPPLVPTSPGNFVIPFVPSVYTHLCLLYIMVPALRGSRHLLTQNLEEIPSNPQGSRSAAPKTQRLCKSAQPAFIYPRFPFAPREPALCRAWRLSHVIYIEYAQETVHWSLTKQGRVSIGSAAIWRHSKITGLAVGY